MNVTSLCLVEDGHILPQSEGVRFTGIPNDAFWSSFVLGYLEGITMRGETWKSCIAAIGGWEIGE